MSAPFTPGPWRAELSGSTEYTVESSSPHMSATVARVLARPGSVTAMADARLIAAAPDLLYVATLVTELAPILGDKNAVVLLARDALKKARGEP